MLVFDTYTFKNPVVQGLASTPNDLYQQTLTGRFVKDIAYNPETQATDDHSDSFVVPVENRRGTDIADLWKEQKRVESTKKKFVQSLKRR